MPHRSLKLAKLRLFAPLLSAALGGSVAFAQDQPPPGPFSGGRADPYFPKATEAQRFPIVNQPAPPPKLGSFSEEPEDAPLPGFREPIIRQAAIGADEANAVPKDALNELGDRFEPGKIVARVGDQVVLYGDVASLVDQDLVGSRDKITNKYQLAELNTYREQRIRSKSVV